LSLPFSQYAQLMSPGGSVVAQANGYADPTCGENFIVVICQSAGKYVALSAACTHACCAVSYTGSDLRCPCHGATFDLTGQCTNGRAGAPLATLSVCSDANGVYVSW
jgi:nitrite reductase/ring-hydroxylating ferredoxin subunit